MADKAAEKATTAGKATTTRTARRRTSETRRTTETKAPELHHTRSLPVPVPELHVRHLALPDVHTPSVHVPSVHLPTVHPQMPGDNTNRILWFGGLAALAALDVIAWPVAGVVAAATYIAERSARAALREQSHADDGGREARRGAGSAAG